MYKCKIQYSLPTMHHSHRLVRTMTHTVSDGAQFVERLYVKPGPLVSSSVQHHPHGVLLQQRRQTLVHRQVLVALQVEELSRDKQMQPDMLNCHVRKKWCKCCTDGKKAACM